MADANSDETLPVSQTLFSPPPLNLLIAGCLTVGIWLGARVALRPVTFLLLALLWFGVSLLLTWGRSGKTATAALLILFVVLGVCRWQVVQPPSERAQLRDLQQSPDSNTVVTLRAQLTTVPVLHEKTPTLFSGPRTAEPQTRFQVRAISVVAPDREIAVHGECRIYVTGDMTSKLISGDTVLLTGRLSWPEPPGNPGEFDFREYLQRQQIAALFFVQHPAHISVTESVGWFNIRRWITFLRHDSRRTIEQSVAPEVKGVALALLLGNRFQLPFETEAAFMASGTMHLLAISGLHVGMLCVFLLRTMNLLLVNRRTALLTTALICVVYAMVTDLRPSVVRATVFFLVFVAAELNGRRVRISSLLSITAIIMLLVQPELVFNTGAWLSFLSVAALGWCARQAPVDLYERSVPLDLNSFADRILRVRDQFLATAAVRMRQMLFVLAITTPLVAFTFHVISPIGLVVNLVLIPAMAFTLCAGFLTLFAGLLLPPLALIPGAAFSGLLRMLTWAVDRTAEIPGGHIYIADLPAWAVPVYYVLILAVIVQQSSAGKTVAAVAAMGVVATACLMSSSRERLNDLHLTVLDIGHGSAAVLEFDNYVLLLDTGALNRGEQAADIICGFLWSRGIRQVNGVVLSHADMDHYNAFPGLPGRVPIAEVITTRDFVASTSPSVQGILQLAADHAIPIRIAAHGDVCELNGVQIELLQADSAALPPGTEDNEKSLVVSVRYADRHLIIPGDLEGRGLTQLLPELGTADLLVSPHHGSKASNTQQLASAIRPQEVVVSARSSKGRVHLENVFADAQVVRMTSEAGAVRTTVRADGTLQVRTFRQVNRPLEAWD